MHPLYPIIDEASFRHQSQQFLASKQAESPAWLLIYHLVRALGAMSCTKRSETICERAILAEQLFLQVLNSVQVVFVHNQLASIQIMLLIVRRSFMPYYMCLLTIFRKRSVLYLFKKRKQVLRGYGVTWGQAR